MREKVAIPEAEERKRKIKMTSRLSVLFFFLDLALIGVIIYEILQLI